ncbi:MAG: CoA ester lyase [Firmicutes bacterium]|nr:CoA ester lyase [Bacillota bacterium]MBR1988837.1 CoA ester lyase [Bacillota bacterium]MBR3705704.1 CoA ester lyase [Bacillota bacterium]
MRRSMLFLPGNSPNILLNADFLGSDAIILDLEDAVAPTEKDSARILVRNAITSLGYTREVIVRINPVESPYWQKDLQQIIKVKPDMIMPTKVSCAQDVKIVSDYIGQMEEEYGIPAGTVKMIPLIETALGVENAYEIASADPRVTAIFLGGEDFTADLRCKRTKGGNEIFYARSRMVVAARAAGVDVYDTPWTDVEDYEGLVEDAKFAKSLGFTGKSSISPRHIPFINEVFSPTEEEIQYAKDVFECIEKAKAEGKGVVSLRGKMIDAPIVARARQVLEAAEAIKGGR